MYALTAIKGCGRRYANICCKKAEIDLRKRAGELVCAIHYGNRFQNSTNEELHIVNVRVAVGVCVCGG